MLVCAGAHDDGCMTAHDDATHLRDDINRDRLALRRMLQAMADEQQRLERMSRAFAAAEKDAKNAIESIWRTEHWGLEPVRPPAWRHPSTDAEKTYQHGERR